MTAAPPAVDERLEWCAALVEQACRDRRVVRGSRWQQQDRVWLSTSTLRSAARGYDWRQEHANPPDGFGSAMLQRVGRAGLIAARRLGSDRDSWRFTTLALAEAWDAETSLTDGERAERCAAAVRRLYAAAQREHGDEVRRWPVATNSGAVPQDGIDLAVDNGMLRRVHLKGPLRATEGYLIPAESWDAYEEATANYETQQARLAARRDDLVDRLHTHAGGRRDNVAYLDIAQLERILALIEPTEP